LTGFFHLSRRQARSLIGDLLGVSISLGALSQFEGRVSSALEEPVKQAHRYAVAQRVKHADGTTWRRAGKYRALWVLATELSTVFKITADGALSTVKSSGIRFSFIHGTSPPSYARHCPSAGSKRNVKTRRERSEEKAPPARSPRISPTTAPSPFLLSAAPTAAPARAPARAPVALASAGCGDAAASASRESRTTPYIVRILDSQLPCDHLAALQQIVRGAVGEDGAGRWSLVDRVQQTEQPVKFAMQWPSRVAFENKSELSRGSQRLRLIPDRFCARRRKAFGSGVHEPDSVK
jgi:hypothetical protein